MNHWDSGLPAGRPGPAWPYGPGDEGTGFVDDDGALPYPVTWERDPAGPYPPWPDAAHPGNEHPGGGYPDRGYPGPAGDGGDWVNEQAPPWAGDSSAGPHRGARLPGRLPRPGRAAGRAERLRPARPRWLVPAVIAVAGILAGAGTVLLANGRPAAPAAIPGTPAATVPAASAPPSPSAAPSAAPATPPLTLAQARGVVAAYTAANNSANARRSGALLATVETGSSYAIDAGLYRMQRAAGAAPYPAFGPARAVYYIPRAEPAAGPRWFAVRVGNAFSSAPRKVVSTEYLLFTQSAPGGAWKNALEPYLLRGAAAPRVAVGADGLATAVAPAAGTLAVAPDQIAGVTAASVDGTPDGAGSLVNAAGAAAGLADRLDQRFWHSRLAAASVTDAHAPGSAVFGLRTADGGALLFYSGSAELTLAPPAGSLLRLTVPGFYSPAVALRRAGLRYADQFAAYDPPAGAGSPRVLASYSGITGKN